MITKEAIISEIIRTAENNDDTPLGMGTFHDETGLKKSDWYGKFWTKWSDAVQEAGFQPNKFGSDAYEETNVLKKIAFMIQELKRFPVQAEFMMQRRNDPDFPTKTTLRNRFGQKEDLLKKVIGYCHAKPELADVAKICRNEISQIDTNKKTDDAELNDAETAHVYLLKHDKVYKIGKSIDVVRRYNEIKTQMPHKLEETHVIETDDPSGIEAYWHNRFKDKRLEGEWFALSASDVKAFKKRRFM